MKTKIDCSFIEEILFQSSVGELDENEKSQIAKHINSCGKCRSSEKLLYYFKQSLQLELRENQLTPNPAILESLKGKLSSANEKQNLIIDFIKGFFELRVPVYQVVTALLIIGAFSFFLNNKNQNFDSFSNNVSIIAAIDSNKISMSFKNSMELIDSYKKGKSIVEDSVLSSFIQSAM
jgi:hypothetical protein